VGTSDNGHRTIEHLNQQALTHGELLSGVLGRYQQPVWSAVEAHALAPYATHAAQSAGRRYPEPLHAYRSPFQRDRDRIVHSSAFRRLSNKTQVFTGEMGDYHRTRLTHTLEVSSIARTVARALRLNEDLTEAMALAHDLGHPPFGHAGEETLDKCLADVGGFNHNRQGLRILEELEQRYPDFPGLNLCQETLTGQAARFDKRANKPGLLETQVVDAADSVAYNTHDADDALAVGLLTLEELLEVPLWKIVAERVRQRFSALQRKELQRAVLHELIQWQVGDLLAGASKTLDEQQIDSVEKVLAAKRIMVASDELGELKADLESFLYERVYRHPQVLAMRVAAQQKLAEMFDSLLADPEKLPDGFRQRVTMDGTARAVGDYLAGMTDRYALRQYGRLCAGGSDI
jgi:dGTPase